MKLSQGKKLLLLGIALVVIDQVIKYLVKTNMELGEQINVIGQWFRLCFVENKGMAFGMSFGGQVGKFLLSLFRIVLSGVLIWWIRSLIKKGTPTGVLVGLTMITAGAVGNILCSVHVRQGGRHVLLPDHPGRRAGDIFQPGVQFRRFLCDGGRFLSASFSVAFFRERREIREKGLNLQPLFRRCGRVVDGGSLENC